MIARFTRKDRHLPLFILDVFLLELNVPAIKVVSTSHHTKPLDTKPRRTYSKCLCNLFRVAYSSPPSDPVPSKELMLGMVSNGVGLL